MDDLSSFLDLGGDDDEDDYIPESLASFVADANKALADAKLNFQEEAETPAKSTGADQSMMDDFPITPVLLEDEDDRNLKEQMLGKLFHSLSEIKNDGSTSTPSAAPESPLAAASSMSTNLFQEAFMTSAEREEEITMDVDDHQDGDDELEEKQQQQLVDALEAATIEENGGSHTMEVDNAVSQHISLAKTRKEDVVPPTIPADSAVVAPKPVAAPVAPQILAVNPAARTIPAADPVAPPILAADPVAPLVLAASPVAPMIPAASPVVPLKTAADPVAPPAVAPPPPRGTQIILLEPQSPAQAQATPLPPSPERAKSPPAVKEPRKEAIAPALEKLQTPAPLVQEEKKTSFWGSFAKTLTGSSATSAAQSPSPKISEKPLPVAGAVDLARSTGDLSTGIAFVAAALSPESSSSKGMAPLPPATNDAAFLPPPPSIVPTASTADDVAAFLPNNNTLVRTNVEPKKTKKTTSPRKMAQMRTSTGSRGVRPTPPVRPKSTVRPKPPVRPSPTARPKPSARPLSVPKRSVVSTARSVLKPNSNNVTPPTTKENGRSKTSSDSAMAKAKERVRQRQLMDKKKRQEATENRAPSVSNGRKIVSLQAAQEKTLGRRRKHQLEVDAKLTAEEERRRRVADKVRSYGSGSTISKAPKIMVSNKYAPPKYSSPKAAPSVGTKERPKLTTPRPFHFHGRGGPVHPSPIDDKKSVVLMGESMDDFNRKLRHSTPLRKMEGRPRLTTPRPFKFHQSKSHESSATKKEQQSRVIPLLAERLEYINRHMREPFPKPPTAVKRDMSKPTEPKSPNFTPVPKRERIKSTEEREKEMMEYNEHNQFRAKAIMTRPPSSGKSLGGVPKVTKKKLTVPRPFRLSIDSRGAHDKHLDVLSTEQRALQEAKAHQFHARPAPKFLATPPKVAVNSGMRYTTKPIRVREAVESPRILADVEECKKQFHAKTMPDFSAGSKLISLMSPKRFLSSHSNSLKSDRGGVPLTIEVRQLRPFHNSRAAPLPTSPGRATQPKPFRLSASNSPAIGSAQKEKKQQQFKARYLPMSTFVPPSSIASPSKASRASSRHHSSASHSTAPRLMTGERTEQREGAVLASRINAELLSREKATVVQRLKSERHQEEMKKASLISPTKRMAASMSPPHLETTARSEVYQKRRQEKLEEEERERRKQTEVKALPMPDYHRAKPTKIKG